MRILVIASATLFGLLSAGVANAGTLTYTGASYPTDEIVTLTDSHLGINENVYAGGITLTAAGYPNGLLAWCVDITHDFINGSATYNLGSPLSNAGLTTSMIGTIGALINNYNNDFTPTTLDSAATQVAIWETVFGTNLTVSGNSAVTSEATELYNEFNGSSLPGNSTLNLLDRGNTGNQDLVYLTYGNESLTPPSNVPEPASFALFGVGLLGLAAIRRREGWLGARS